MFLENSKSKSGAAEEVTFASIMDDDVEDKIEYNGHAKFDNDSGTPTNSNFIILTNI